MAVDGREPGVWVVVAVNVPLDEFPTGGVVRRSGPLGLVGCPEATCHTGSTRSMNNITLHIGYLSCLYVKNQNKVVVGYNYRYLHIVTSYFQLVSVCLFTVILQLTSNHYYNYARLKSIGFFYEKKEVDL